jgi:ABC-type lipoprotein release transport system permease subunit
MTARDLFRVSLGNLWRRKLRSALTIAGVVIAIGAFVTMLSLGAGNQQMITEEFEDSGLLSAVQVYPRAEEGGIGGSGRHRAGDDHDRADGDGTGRKSDEVTAVPLDDVAVAELAALPGVRMAYPFQDFEVEVAWGDSVVSAKAQARPPGAESFRLFTRLAAGEPLAADDDDGMLVAERFLHELGLEGAESIVGQTVRVSVRSVSPDSGFARVLEGLEERARAEWETVAPESLRSRAYVETRLLEEASNAAQRFLDGYMNAPLVTEDTLTVRGVLEGGDRRARRAALIPVETARRFAAAGPGADPTELLPSVMRGDLFLRPADRLSRGYSQATLVLAATASHPAIVDSVEARGFRAFSYAAEFSQIRRALMFFQLGLASVGLVALATAALGIVNTMVMSVSERRREIGIFRSLGAEDGDIRSLFLVESAAIGAIGSALGVLLGWTVARIGSAIAQELMRRQDVPPMDLFATPPWLVGLAIGFGTLIAVLAGWLPAARAARIDPVRALRQD